MKISGGSSEETVVLREYRAGDWERMYALDVECFEPEFRFSRRVMRGFAEDPGAMTVLAEARGDLVGFCVVQMEGQVGYVVTLEAKARAAGGAGMALHVFAGNAGAMRFYEGIGYGRAGRVEGFYGRGLDALVYRKRFEG